MPDERTTEYSPEEKRVCEYLQRITNNQIGCGDDPIGFLIASHATYLAEVGKHPAYRAEVETAKRELAEILAAARLNIAFAEQERDAAKAERDDLQATFDLRWEADMRAIKRWQAAEPGRELTWPDHADLCVWLLERREDDLARFTAAMKAMEEELDRRQNRDLTKPTDTA